MAGTTRAQAPLGRLQAVALYAGAVIGSGILVIPGVAAELAGPASLLAWLGMAAATLPLAVTMAALAARYPGGGGVAAFAERAFGPVAGGAVGWLFLSAVPVAAPVAALIGAHHAGAAWGLDDGGRLLLAGGILLGALAANYFGVRTTGWVQVAVVTGIVAILVATVAVAAPQVSPGRFLPFAPHGWRSVGQAAALLFWCFVGWETVTHFSGEFGRPARDLVPAVLWAAALVCVLYLAAAAVVVGTGSYGPDGRTEAGLAALLDTVAGPAAARVAGITALFCAAATINAYVGAAAQLARALARAGQAPLLLAATHPRSGAPVGGLAFLAIGHAATLALTASGVAGFRDLIALPTSSFIATYVLGSAAGVRLAGARAPRLLALAALAVSASAYPFLGWAALYPPLVLGACWFLSLRSRGRSGQPEASPPAGRAPGMLAT